MENPALPRIVNNVELARLSTVFAMLLRGEVP